MTSPRNRVVTLERRDSDFPSYKLASRNIKAYNEAVSNWIIGLQRRLNLMTATPGKLDYYIGNRYYDEFDG